MVFALLLALAAGPVQDTVPPDGGETITISTNCALTLCQDGPPESEWDEASCSDYSLDLALIDSMEQGDRSAAELLRRRFTDASTYSEKLTIAGALLRQVPDDGVYWKWLYEHARNAVRFETDGESSAEFEAWCEERRYDRVSYEAVSHAALNIISSDPRARPLLLEALDRDLDSLNELAIRAFGEQHDLSALPAIERALDRYRDNGDDPAFIALTLIEFEDEKADELALRYLTGEDREQYIAFREEAREK